MFKLTEAQIQREIRAAAAAEAAERVWRRRWRGVLAGCFASQWAATAVGGRRRARTLHDRGHLGG